MKPFILEFMNLGGAEIGIILIVVLLPFVLTLYSVVDIVRSEFKDANTKILFLLLVILAPIIGSIAYLLLRGNYKKPGSNADNKMPV